MCLLENIPITIVANFIRLRAMSTLTTCEEAMYAPFCADIECYKCPCGTDTGHCSIAIALHCDYVSHIPWKELDLYIKVRFPKETYPELYI